MIAVSVLETAQGGQSLWSNVDQICPQDLADLWASGTYVAPRLQQGKGKSVGYKFENGHALMARVALARLPLDVALSADFTRRYCTVAAYAPLSEGGGELLMAFKLPEPITSAKSFSRLLTGLESLYAGAATHACAEQSYGLADGGETIVLGQELDGAAVKYLDQLGLEAKQTRDGEGAYVRSHVTLNRSAAVRLPGGEEVALQNLGPGTPILCPVHIDDRPEALVRWFSDRTPAVICDHCRRTYAASTTRRRYDFGEFDRMIRTLAETDDAKGALRIQRERFLPPLQVKQSRSKRPTGIIRRPRKALRHTSLEVGQLESGVTFVKSGKGTGKTEVLNELVTAATRSKLEVLVIGHRRSLMQTIAKRLGISCYFALNDNATTNASLRKLEEEAGADSEQTTRFTDALTLEKTFGPYTCVGPRSRYAVCLDSLCELSPQRDRYHTVIIDEAEQVFTHLIGNTLKSRRREVFLRLKHYLRTAFHVILLDADLDMITIDAALEIFDPETGVQLVINEPASTQGDVYVYGSKGQVTSKLIEHVGQGKKCFVATNSKRKAKDLEKILSALYSEKSIMVVTADNSQQADVQVLLDNIAEEFENHLDVLIASPAIGTGIDITFKSSRPSETHKVIFDTDEVPKCIEPRTVVDSVFGFFEGNITTHFDIDQQLMRVRHPGEVHVWVDSTPLNYETEIGCIKHELEKSVRQTNYLLKFEDDGTPVFSGDEGLINIWARIVAASRGSKNELASLFTALRLKNGWNPIFVEYDEDSADVGRAALREGRAQRLAEREDRVLAAEILDAEEAQSLISKDKRGLPLTNAERDALERYFIESFYDDGEITPELIAFDKEGRTREQIRNLECLVLEQGHVEAPDLDEAKFVAFDRKRRLAQRELLGALFGSAGLFDSNTRTFKTDARVDIATLDAFLEALREHRKQLETLFGVPLRADCWNNPVLQLGALLDLVGLSFGEAAVDQGGGKKVRRYGLDEDRLVSLMAVVKLREAKRERDMPEQNGSEDKRTRSVNKTIRGPGFGSKSALAQALKSIDARRGA